MKKLRLKRFRNFGIVVLVVLAMLLFDREMGREAFRVAGYSFKEMIMILPPIFILLGLLDVWVPRDTMVKYMGRGSGIKGIILSILLGSAAAGPLYGAFPIAAVFMKKGVSFRNILIFIGAWSTTKIPMILFEMASLGSRFAFIRLAVDIPGIILIAYLLERLLSKEEVEKIYMNAEQNL